MLTAILIHLATHELPLIALGLWGWYERRRDRACYHCEVPEFHPTSLADQALAWLQRFCPPQPWPERTIEVPPHAAPPTDCPFCEGALYPMSEDGDRMICSQCGARERSRIEVDLG